MGGVPQPFVSVISGSLGTVGPVTVGGSLCAVGPVTVAGIPDTFHINVDKLPKIQIGVDPVTLHLDPVDFNVSIKEIPSIRAHLPVDFNVGLSLLGMELLCVRLCGEAQVITEPYRPNLCERCGTLPIKILTDSTATLATAVMNDQQVEPPTQQTDNSNFIGYPVDAGG